MKNLFINLFVALLFTGSLYANDVYVTQSGNTLDLDITQDGQNNTVGNSTTASTVITEMIHPHSKETVIKQIILRKAF